MSDQLLFLLKLCLLALLYLFFFRVLRAVWAELRAPAAASVAAPGGTAGSRPAQGSPAAPVRPPVPAPPAPSASRAPAHQPTTSQLVVVEPQGLAGDTYPLESEITLGRAPGCRVSLDDSFVSQVHARVFSRDGAWFVEDMGSTNGTFLNGQKVAGPTKMDEGDRLKVGGTVLEMR